MRENTVQGARYVLRTPVLTKERSEELPSDQAVTHRRGESKEQSILPHQVGRPYARLQVDRGSTCEAAAAWAELDSLFDEPLSDVVVAGVEAGCDGSDRLAGLVHLLCKFDLVACERLAAQHYPLVSKQSQDAGLREPIGLTETRRRCAGLVLGDDPPDEDRFETPAKRSAHLLDGHRGGGEIRRQIYQFLQFH